MSTSFHHVVLLNDSHTLQVTIFRILISEIRVAQMPNLRTAELLQQQLF